MQSLEDIPTWFSDWMEISLEAAQVILSVVVILAVLLPVFYLARGRRGIMIEIVLLVLTESFLVGIGWLPFWLLIATVAVMAMAIASLGTKVVTGG
ncbi:MAG: hypothetical protein ACYTDW_06140 [Planctomycetota bacterium]|jgi:hypothetical protein